MPIVLFRVLWSKITCTMAATHTMKAVRVTAYHAPMEMQDVAVPAVQSALDVIVRIGAAGNAGPL